MSSGSGPFYPLGSVTGDEIVAEGMAGQLAKEPPSYMGTYLASLLKLKKVAQAAE